MIMLKTVGKDDLLNQDRSFAIAITIIAAVYTVLFLYFVDRASIRVPVMDTLDWFQLYGQRLQSGDWSGYLWTPYNEHRQVWSRILLAIDIRWFNGNGTAFAFFGLLLLIAMVAAVCWEILKSDCSVSLKATAIPMAVLLLTPADTVVMIGMPIMGVFLYTAAFAVFSLVLLDGVVEQGRFSNYRRTAAIVAACLAAFGVSGGLLIWPVLIWSAWKGGLRSKWIAVITCVGGIFSALYVGGLHSPHSSWSSFAIDHFVRNLDYAIRFLGLPWSHLQQLVWPSRFIGVSIICLGGFFLIHNGLSTQFGTRLERFGSALVLFTFLLAAAAAFARSDWLGDREMSIRYSVLVVLVHVGLLLCSLGYLQIVWRGAYRRPLQWLAITISVALVCQQIVAGRFVIREADQYKDSWSRFVAGDWTPEMLHYVYWDRDQARAGLAYLRAMQIPHVE
jgi:hypothetical protein